MGVSNKVTAILNFVAFLAAIPIIASGIWLANKADNECTRYFRWPVVILGVLILLVALAGFVGAYWNRQGLLAFYLCCMAILIGLLLILLVFAFIVTRPNGAYSVPGRAYNEYRLDGFSEWLRDHVTNSANWGKIRTCLAESDVCSKLTQNYISADQFFAAHISPLQASRVLVLSFSFFQLYSTCFSLGAPIAVISFNCRFYIERKIPFLFNFVSTLRILKKIHQRISKK
jgi:hypothetical protein